APDQRQYLEPPAWPAGPAGLLVLAPWEMDGAVAVQDAPAAPPPEHGDGDVPGKPAGGGRAIAMYRLPLLPARQGVRGRLLCVQEPAAGVGHAAAPAGLRITIHPL